MSPNGVRQHICRQISIVIVLTLCTAAAERDAFAGVVVESVTAHSVAERVGIAAGDVLVSWRRGDPQAPAAHGLLETPFDVWQFETEQSQRPDVSVRVQRGERALRFRLYPGRLGLGVQPNVDGPDFDDYLAGKKFVDTEMVQRGFDVWRDLIARLESRGETTASCWLSLRIADIQSQYGLTQAPATFQRTDTLCRPLPPLARAHVSEHYAGQMASQDDFQAAERLYRVALTLRQTHAPDSLSVASSLHDLGVLARMRQLEGNARDLLRQAVTIRRRLAPGSLCLARSLGDLAIVAGDPPRSERLYREALAIIERVAPIDPDAAATYNNFAILTLIRGDLVRGERLLRRTVEVDRKLGNPPGPMTVMNLGLVAMERGNLAEAESLLLDALLRQQMFKDGLATAGILQNLGNLAVMQGDFAAAESYQQRALRIRQGVNPGAQSHGMSLVALGELAHRRGDFTRAESLYRQALEIFGRADDHAADVRVVQRRFAELELDRGNLDAALDFARRGIEDHPPDGARIPGEAYATLARVYHARGMLAEAEQAYRSALTTAHPAPGTWREADWLHALGMVVEGQGRRGEALTLLRRAVESLESQRRRVGSDQARAAFSRQSAAVHADYLDLLVEDGQREAAFHVLERSRANAFLERLAERDLVFAADLPEGLREYRTLMEADFDRVQEQLAALDPQRDKAEIVRKRERLTELTARLAEIQRRVKSQSPRLAQLQYPVPLTFAEASRFLRRGSVLLAFSVGAGRTRLFVGRAPERARAQPGLQLITIPLGRDALASRVEGFRRSLERAGDGPSASLDVIASGGDLYDLLLRPADGAISAAERLLVVPDASLHALPFGALTRRGAGQAPRFLIETVAVTTAPSMTVFAELARRPRVPNGPLLATAFGDPRYPSALAKPVKRTRSELPDEPQLEGQVDPGAVESDAGSEAQSPEQSTDAEVAAVLRSGATLVPLPASRDEATAITNLYAPKSALYVGAAATERQARAIPSGTRIVHFAVHGIVNERFPLNSALAFTIPQRRGDTEENGLLQAWEIIDHVRLDADLVTLSTCQSAIGSSAGGEGLLTLARAFQYAGARSVLASLWRVEDRATAQLMTIFYRNLRGGASIAESLRSAQLALMRTDEYKHPFYWAAFTISGYGE